MTLSTHPRPEPTLKKEKGYISFLFFVFMSACRMKFVKLVRVSSLSQWQHGLRRGSAAARLLRLWVRISSGTWMSVSCFLSGKVLCVRLITRPVESYRMWCVVVCDLKTS